MQKAKWIWENNNNKNDEYVHFIDEFIITDNSNVILNISCDTDYTVYINGKLTAFGQYADYPYYKVYDEIDISEFTKKGINRIAICAYYAGDTFFTHYCEKAGLIYEVLQDCNILAYSSENTKCRLAFDYVSYKQEIITSQLGYGYKYDMSSYDGWNMPDYDYSAFINSTIIQNMSEELHLRPVKKLILDKLRTGELIKTGSFTYKGGATEAEKQQKASIEYDAKTDGNTITVKKNGVYALYDLGCEEVGFLYLKIKTKEKTNISIGYGEHITDGKIRSYIGGRNFAVGYKSKQGEQEYLNTFRRFGARYLQIFAETSSIEITEMGILPTIYPFTEKRFVSENALRQSIYDVSVRTLRLCVHEHYEDCPWREQSLYNLDSRNQMLCGYYAFKETDMARASLKLIGLDRRKDDLLSICCPSKTTLTIPSFSLYYIIQIYEYMFYTKDNTLAAEFFEKMQRTLNVFLNRISNGLVPVFDGDADYWNFYEWTEGLEGCLLQKESKKYDVILNCLLSLALNHMAKICNLLNKKQNEIYYYNIQNQLNKAINKEFFDATRGLYITRIGEKGYSELGNSLAILCGATEGKIKEGIAKQLADKENNMTKITLSMLCFKYDALLDANKDKYKDYVLQDIDNNYSYMLNCGATSFWETLKGESDFEDAGSLCHGWSAMPVYYYSILKEKM